MTAPSKRKTRPQASRYSFTSKAPREWLPTKSSFSTSARTKPPVTFPLRKTWVRARLPLQRPQQRQRPLRPSPPSRGFGPSSAGIASPVPRSGNVQPDRASVFSDTVLGFQIGPCLYPLLTARLFLSP